MIDFNEVCSPIEIQDPFAYCFQICFRVYNYTVYCCCAVQSSIFYKIVAVYFMCSTKLCYRLLKFLTALLFTTSYVALKL